MTVTVMRAIDVSESDDTNEDESEVELDNHHVLQHLILVAELFGHC